MLSDILLTSQPRLTDTQMDQSRPVNPQSIQHVLFKFSAASNHTENTIVHSTDECLHLTSHQIVGRNILIQRQL